MKLKITVRARGDLLDIGEYTAERWGDRQAERYLRLLDAQLRALTVRPTPGRRCDEIRRGLHRVSAGRHVIFFRLTQSVVTVVRVLHAQMLPRRHL